ncbi:MAG: SpoIIE family protein phosphatase [Spirochaetes bacterium]|nr:SpoIIE family protein phosphatase [Spirochaetota bacterium]
MKFNLRYKIFFWIMALNFVVAALLGFFMYRTSSDEFFDRFRRHKLSIAQFIATAIDGDVHERLTEEKMTVGNEKYWHYIRLISTIGKQEKDVRYIYSVNYDRAKDRLYYVLDGNIPDQDLLWFETDHFAFDMFFDKDGRMTVEYNYRFYKNDFEIDTEIGRVRITFRDTPPLRRLMLNDQAVFTVRSTDPLSAHCPGGFAHRNDRVKEGPIMLNGREVDCLITYSGKGEPSSYPGNDFVEKKEIVQFIKTLILEKRNFIDPEPIRNAYGEFISAYAVITNGRNEGIGAVMVDINSRDVEVFRRRILMVAALVFLATFAISTLLAVILSRHITRPLSRLMEGVTRLSGGDMTALVDVRTGDEIGRLARSFNTMVKNLNLASEEQKRLIDEIRSLNEGLEQRVAERTLTIQEQSQELNRQIMMARKIQMSLLPGRLPDLDRVSIAFKYQPMMGVGGDFMDFYCSENEVMLFICDVSGHGVPAAFLAAMVKMSLPACYASGNSPSRAINVLYESLKEKLGGHLISAIFCHLDMATGTLRSANAGHPAIIIIRAGGEIEYVGSQGHILSETFPPTQTDVVTTLGRGDKIMLYTDGIIEARNGDKVMYGEERLDRLIRQNASLSAEDLCETIYRKIVTYIGSTSREFEDDITILVSEYRG